MNEFFQLSPFFAQVFRWLRIGFEIVAAIVIVATVVGMLSERQARLGAEQAAAARRSAGSKKAWITRRAKKQEEDK